MGKSKQETKQQQTVTPTNPEFVLRAVTNQQQRTEDLGQRDPREFVAPASQLQNAAFSLAGGLANRMGATSFDFGNMQVGGDNQSGLLNTTSMSQPMTTQPAGREPVSFPSRVSPSLSAGPMGAMQMRGGQPDFAGYVSSQPDLAAEYSRISNEGFGASLPRSFDANGDGRLQQGEYGAFHSQTFGQNEGRNVPMVPGTMPMPQQQPAAPVQPRNPVTGAAAGQVGATELSGPNPNDFFTGAGLLAGQVGMSGANTVGDVALSQAGLLDPAQGYRASGPAGVERGQAAGPAMAAGYDPAGQAGIERAQAAQGQSVGGAAIQQGQAALGQSTGAAAIERAQAAQGSAQGAASITDANSALMSPAERAAIAQGQASGPAGVTQAGVSGAQASLLGDPSTFAASLVGDPQSVNLQGFDAAQGRATNVGALPSAQAAQINQADIDRFMNPFLGEVVDSTRADMQEQFGQQRAALDARAAGAGAFGGSRFGVRESQLDGEQSRALGSTLGGLRASGFNTALDFADRDVGRRQGANMADFNLQGQAALADANAANTFGLANLDSENAARRFGAEQGNMGLLANQDADLRASLADAGFLNEADMFGASAANEFDRLNQQAGQEVGLFNAGEQNVASRFNAGEANRSALDAAGRSDQFGLANMDAFNRAEMDRVGRQDAAGQFNADTQTRVGLANAGARNAAEMDRVGRADQFNLSNLDAQNRANLANQDAFNRSSLDAAGRADQFGLANADAQNRFSLANQDAFNASEMDRVGRADQFGMANMDARNRTNLANSDAFNRSSLDAAGRQDQAGAFAADAVNRSGLDFAGRSDAMGMQNADAVNRSLLDFAGRADQSGQFNAGAMNDFARTQFGADTDANFRNADSMNNMSQFNAGQRDTNMARRLQAAGLLGDLGSTVGAEDRANIGLLAGLGGEQREIDRAYRNAEPTMAELLGQLNAMQQFSLFQGQNSNSTSTQTQQASGLDQIGQAVGIATALGGMMTGNPAMMAGGAKKAKGKF